MADLILKDVPENVLQHLRLQAAQNRRTVVEEAIACLASAVVPPRIDVEARIAELRALRAELDLPPLTQEFLDEAKSEGRE